MGHEKVYAVCENKCFVETMTKNQIEEMGKKVIQFTYEVNSDESLAYWLSNKESGTSSGGDDFTSVLIRKGTWTFTEKTSSLDEIGTLYVEGEVGSKIVGEAWSEEKYLRYDKLNPMTAMKNVNVECSMKTSLFVGSYIFYRCSNLTNCFGKITQREGAGSTAVFLDCENLINCIGHGIAGEADAFLGCSNLINCKGHGINAFFSCTVVHGCKADGHCSGNPFDDSFAANSKYAEYACDDTPAGGFNDTTNPVA